MLKKNGITPHQLSMKSVNESSISDEDGRNPHNYKSPQKIDFGRISMSFKQPKDEKPSSPYIKVLRKASFAIKKTEIEFDTLSSALRSTIEEKKVPI